MKVSVAMAVYNGEKYIQEQLESVWNQTRLVNEVVISDDRSTDHTVEVIKKFIVQHGLQNTWKVFENEKNLGYAANFMNAAKRTSHELVMFCDQDDIWVSNRVEQIERLMKENKQIMVLGSEYEPFRCTPDAVKPQRWELKAQKNDGSLERIIFQPQHFFIGCQGCTMCVRRTFFKKIESYWIPGWAHDDFVWKLALCVNGLFIYHKTTLKRRLHAGNVSLQRIHELTKRILFLENMLQAYEQTLRFAQDIQLSQKKIRSLERVIQASKLRIELLRNKRYRNVFLLTLKYLNCFHKSRAIITELYLSVKGTKKVDKKIAA